MLNKCLRATLIVLKHVNFFQCQNKMYKKCIAMQNVMFVNNATVFQLKLKHNIVQLKHAILEKYFMS